MLKLPAHNRYAYSPIVERKDYSWPGGKRLAFYIALNIEHFAFGAGIGMDPVRSGQQTTRNFAWRSGRSRNGCPTIKPCNARANTSGCRCDCSSISSN